MLVIYRGTLSSDTPLPATLTLRLPKQAGQPNAVAYEDQSGNLFNATYSVEVADEWLLVTLETPRPNFQLEFYDGLSRAGDVRSYTFNWPGDYAVDQLDLLLLPPSGATDVQAEPPLSPQSDTDSTTFSGALGSLAAGQQARLVVRYNGSGGSSSTGERNSNIPLIVAVAVAALLLAGVGGVWYVRRPAPGPEPAPSPRRRPKRSRSQRRRRSSARQPSEKATAQPVSSPRYCTHCGRQLSDDDRFCGSCGTAAPV
jgi:hypothetical protein